MLLNLFTGKIFMQVIITLMLMQAVAYGYSQDYKLAAVLSSYALANYLIFLV
jgi:hypothetical protein